MLCNLHLWASQVLVKMYSTDSHINPKLLGEIIIKDSEFGLLIIPDLRLKSIGYHGFHVHEKPNCGSSGKSSGGHFDPENTGLHLGPYNKLGHLGDLPNLFVDQEGKAVIPILAPRLKVKDIVNRALIIHSKIDHYDQESFLHSGNRIACGVILAVS